MNLWAIVTMIADVRYPGAMRSPARLDEVFRHADDGPSQVSWTPVRSSPDGTLMIVMTAGDLDPVADEPGVFAAVTRTQAEVQVTAWEDYERAAMQDPLHADHDRFKVVEPSGEVDLAGEPTRLTWASWDRWENYPWAMRRPGGSLPPKWGTHRATVDHGANISADATWDLVTDLHRITASIAINDGVTVTIDPGTGGAINPVEFTGNYILTINGALVTGANASRTRKWVIESSAAVPLPSDWSQIYFPDDFDNGSSLKWVTIRHCDYPLVIFEPAAGAATVDVDYVYLTQFTVTGVYLDSNGTIPAIQHAVIDRRNGNNAATWVNNVANGATFTNCEFRGSSWGAGFGIGPTGTMTFNKCLFPDMNVAEAFGTAANGTFTRCYWAGASVSMNTYLLQTTTVKTITFTDNLFEHMRVGILLYSTANLAGFGVTRCDFISCADRYPTIYGTATAGTDMDNVFISGAESSDHGTVNSDVTIPSQAGTPQSYLQVKSNTNWRANPNFARAISSVVATAADNGATITWNTGVPGSSEVYLSETAGIDPDDSSTYELAMTITPDWTGWHKPDTPKDAASGALLNAGAHSVTIDGLKPGTLYYYVCRTRDMGFFNGVIAELGIFDAAEGSFTTTGAAGAGGQLVSTMTPGHVTVGLG